MANEQTNQTKRITAIEAMGKEMAYLMTRRSMPWQKAMASALLKLISLMLL